MLSVLCKHIAVTVKLNPIKLICNACGEEVPDEWPADDSN